MASKLCSWLLLASLAHTGAVLASEHREHGAHVHGQAMLNVVLDGSALSIAFDSPAMNLLGFEHAPHTAAEKAALKQVASNLADVQSVFTLQGGNCQVQDQEIQMPYGEHDEAAGHGEHADIEASYTFACEEGQSLQSIQVKLFAAYPGFQQLDVEWLIFSRQGKTVLTRDNPDMVLQQ